jgi:hypothetical protein
MGRDGAKQRTDLVLKETGIFLQTRMDKANHRIAQVVLVGLDADYGLNSDIA